jgi:hypothetical protein
MPESIWIAGMLGSVQKKNRWVLLSGSLLLLDPGPSCPLGGRDLAPSRS